MLITRFVWNKCLIEIRVQCKWAVGIDDCKTKYGDYRGYWQLRWFYSRCLTSFEKTFRSNLH